MAISETTLIVLLVLLAVFIVGMLATWRGGGWKVATKWLNLQVDPNREAPREERSPVETRPERGSGNISDVQILGGGATISGSSVPIQVGHTATYGSPPAHPSSEGPPTAEKGVTGPDSQGRHPGDK